MFSKEELTSDGVRDFTKIQYFPIARNIIRVRFENIEDSFDVKHKAGQKDH